MRAKGKGEAVPEAPKEAEIMDDAYDEDFDPMDGLSSAVRRCARAARSAGPAPTHAHRQRRVQPAAPGVAGAQRTGEPCAPLWAAARRRVLALKELQESYDTMNRGYQLELAQLQDKYLKKYGEC